MKCPKCGYTSFESYDSCRRCSADLLEFKQTHGLAALVLPPSLRANMVADLGGGQADIDTSPENASDMFNFDLPTERQTTAPSSAPSSDPFSFDDTPAAAVTAFSFDTPSPPPQDDPFAALIESTPQSQHKESAPQPSSSQGLETNSFSWDDTPTPGQPGSVPDDIDKSVDDDFNSLFGDLGGSGTK